MNKTHNGKEKYCILTIINYGYEPIDYNNMDFTHVVVHEKDLIDELKYELKAEHDSDDPYREDLLDKKIDSCTTKEELQEWVNSKKFAELTDGLKLSWCVSHYRERILDKCT